MIKEEIISHCLTYNDVYKNQPFDDKWTVIRHKRNKKIFAMIFKLDRNLCLNLKCEPNKADLLRTIYDDVKPGYHMNKTHWNTIILDRNMKEDDIFEMVHHSFELTKPKSNKQT
ncbi:MmcQ/YjbR family DNA-binding protein [Paenibacillus urinalis]|uniref:MmcQ/YjbR family DNA-binding protein n=1 Tax=Paenibacillus urinalis TaxID=521520 RepID=A0ABY7X2Z8_9BACL|nr:MmcQ/YjbR family DNA-binding protein [Paenibacillus urinalis]WDH96582.1 MmcQ/YjbR family DNA-binding protein [Paenibacillus urinalis]WDI00229.1 MmcQ/YjbR family DNA-binding protein [Paenibacillus urinalis]